jgi:hypothetical protein
MANLQQTRLLLFGQSPESDWGWWYQFFQPEAIERVEFGTVIHGWRPRLALQVRYRVEANEGREEMVETVLTFDDEQMRTLAWVDLTQEMREHAANS